MISDGVAYTVADVMKGTLDYGTAVGHDIRLPGGRQDRDHRGAGRRLVRRLHAARLDRGLGRQPGLARTPLPGYGADLAAPIWHDYMTVAAAKPCDDFPEPQNPADLSSYSSSHTDSYAELDDHHRRLRHDDADHDDAGRHRQRDGDGTGDTNGYDPDLYAPGAGQDPAPTPNTGGAGGVDPN